MHTFPSELTGHRRIISWCGVVDGGKEPEDARYHDL